MVMVEVLKTKERERGKEELDGETWREKRISKTRTRSNHNAFKRKTRTRDNENQIRYSREPQKDRLSKRLEPPFLGVSRVFSSPPATPSVGARGVGSVDLRQSLAMPFLPDLTLPAHCAPTP